MMEQHHISVQLTHKMVNFLYSVSNSVNPIVKLIGNLAQNDASSPMGANLATLRYHYGIDLKANMTHSIIRNIVNDHHKVGASIINQGRTIMELLDVRCGYSIINPSGFSKDDITLMIQHICID